ncbi:hypothetical protein DI383_00445 [Flavobacteriaceae bacterium LYZ1037]|nr:hypothetical protein DI383_00445 [Flavobacteriaceae bacterium LYZ1037]
MKKKYFSLKTNTLHVFTLLCFLISFSGFGQGDICSGSTTLTIETSCTTTPYNITGLSNSMASPSCATSYRDGWFSFTTGTSTTNITINCVGNRRISIALYSGVCTGLTEEYCAQDTVTAGEPSLVNIAVTPSTTYYLRIMRSNNAGTNSTTGTICVYDSTVSCAGTTTNFYDTGGPGNNYSNNELETWTFYPDGGPVTATFTAFNLENGWDFLYVYDGPNAGSPQVAGSPFSGNLGSIGPFTSTHATQTLTFEFDSDGSNTRPGWEASVCGIPAPCNEPTLTAATNVLTSTATINWNAAVPAPSTGYQYAVSLDNSGTTPGNDIIGTTGAGITTANIVGLTPNTTYYVFIRSICNSGNFSTINGPIIFTTDPITVPGNDEPCNAIPLTVGSSCSFATYTNEYATATAGVPAPTCSFYSGGDVWFTAVVPANGTLIIDTDTGVITDSGMEIYSATGSCPGSLTLNSIECDDDGSTNGAMSYINRSGLNPGDTIYIRVWEYGNDNNGTFDICVYTPPPCTMPNSPTNLTIGTVTDNSIAGTFTGSGANNYLVLMNTTGTPPSAPVDGTVYGIGNTALGATVIDTDGNTNFIANGLNSNTQYYFWVYSFNNTAACAGPAYGNSTPTTTATTTTCSPTSTYNSEYINNFTATGDGASNINNLGTGGGITASGYSNYSQAPGGPLTVSQSEGGIVNFTVNMAPTIWTYGFNIWVDWDDDSNFSAAELVYASGAYVTAATGSFTIPGGTAGTHVMRIRSSEFDTSPPACGNISYGEAEDYLITITPLNCTANPQTLTAVSSTTTTATISWTHASPLPGNGYEYIISTDNSTSTPAGDITGTTAGNSVNLTGLLAGTTYYVFVRGVCNAVDNGVWITTTFTTGCSDTVNTPTVCPIIVGEVGVDPFTADPFNPDPSFGLDCSNPTITLEAHSNLKQTTSYIVEKITYPNPVPEYDFPIFGNGVPQVITTDDVWADAATPIPFNFNFYNQCYDETLVGANGLITFDFDNNIGTALPSPGQGSGWQYSNNLPSTVNSLFEHTIYGVYHDIDPTGMTGTPIKSRVIGTEPCRQLQVSWNNIPMFGDSSTFYTGMIILHETTNIIEVFIEEKRLENNGTSIWNDGNATVGIQGNNVDNNPGNPANEFAVAPCRNGIDPNWETFNEAWRFTPDGAVINHNSITWYSDSNGGVGGTSIGTGPTLTVTTPDTYTAVATYTICGAPVTLTDDVVVTQSSKTWMGYIDNNWYVDGNWEPNGIPTASDCVLIPDIAVSNVDFPIVDEAVGLTTIPLPPSIIGFALNLTVAPTARLEIASDTELVVTDWIHLDGTIDIRDSGSLIQVTNGAPNVNNNTGNGVINMQRTVPGGVNGYDYIYWSSPTDNDFSVTDISDATGELIYVWNPTLNGITHGDWIPASGLMENGKGYIVRGLQSTSPIPANTTQFSGKPQNGAITTPITRGTHITGPYTAPGDVQATNEDDNWNLIGNPYPSAISYTDFMSANIHIDGTIYFWTHQSAPVNPNSPFYYDFLYNYSDDYIDNNYTGSNPPGFNGDIAAGQAFFVLMLDDVNGTGVSEDVIFNNTMRHPTYDNGQFYRTNNSNSSSTNMERHRIWLDLIDPNEIGTSILVGYVEGATNENDRLYDGYEFAGSAISFYSLINEEKMSIQGRALPFEETDMVPLGLVVPQSENYTIAINSLDGLFETDAQDIYLEDTYLGIIHDLRIAPYSFNTEEGTFNDRFILRYTNNYLNIEEVSILNGLVISAPNNNYIKVTSGTETIKSVTIYDVSGKLLYNNHNINKMELTINNINHSDGVLFVKATLNNGLQKTQKVVMKQ